MKLNKTKYSNIDIYPINPAILIDNNYILYHN